MGGRSARNRAPQVDPFYEVPPSGVPGTIGPAGGEFITSYPFEEFVPESPQIPAMQALYGRPNVSLPNVYVSFYPQGLNQVPGIGPWNYGNYFLGNTAMQMMPGDIFNSSLMSPSFSMPMASSMMAAATPLPVALNPLVQGMYPMASVNPANWMDPSSFMSALSSGPMPYRPPGIDFPSNVGAIMTIPYGASNPLMSLPSYGTPSVLPPAPSPVSYYPSPASVPQPYPVPYPNPTPVHSIQPLPIPQPALVSAPSAATPYSPAANQPVISSLSNPVLNNYAPPSQPRGPASYPASVSQPHASLIDRVRSLLPSFSRSSHSNYNVASSPPRRNPDVPPITQGQLISDSGWLPMSGPGTVVSDSGWVPGTKSGKVVSDSGWLPKKSRSRTVPSLFGGNKRKQMPYPSSGGHVSFHPRQPLRHSSSSVSEYDCPICQQERDLRRLREKYGSSIVSSFISSPDEPRKHHLTTNDSILSSLAPGSTSSKPSTFKSHRRHPIRIKNASKTPSPKPSTSPLFLRKSLLAEVIDETIHEEVPAEKASIVETIPDVSDSNSEKSDRSSVVTK